MKTILITGGNKGIGLATTQIFLDAGHRVIVVARNATSMLLKHKNLQTIDFDLCSIAGIAQLAAQIGAIDVLVNNAGIMHSLPYNNYAEARKQQMLQLNLEAPVELMTAFAPYFIKQGSGRIISLASIAGQYGHPDVWYGITKAGIINATKSFAKILGPHNCQVNCVAPGPVEGTDLFNVIAPERRAQIKASSLTPNFTTPADVAKIIYWLALEAPANINGTCIDINNGAFFR